MSFISINHTTSQANLVKIVRYLKYKSKNEKQIIPFFSLPVLESQLTRFLTHTHTQIKQLPKANLIKYFKYLFYLLNKKLGENFKIYIIKQIIIIIFIIIINLICEYVCVLSCRL